VGVEIHPFAQVECRFPAANMKLVDRDKVSRRQFIEIFAGAPQVVRECIGQLEAFTVMACHAVGHRP
jgi:hypothetical protein